MSDDTQPVRVNMFGNMFGNWLSKVHRALVCALELLGHLVAQGEKIMSAISEFAAKQNEHNDKIELAIAGIAGDITSLKNMIQQLQTSPGPITPEDQALLDQLETRTSQLENKLTALDDLTPPEVPAVTP